MITGQTILKIAAKGGLVHCVTRDYGAEFAATHPGSPRVSVNHFATYGQALRDMDSVFNDVVKPVYSTIPASELAKAPHVGDFFYTLA